MEEGESIRKRFKCMFCSRSSASEEGILDHVKSKHTRQFLSRNGKKGGRLYRDRVGSSSSVGVEPNSSGLPLQAAQATRPGLSASTVEVRNSGAMSPVTGFGNLFPNPSYSPVAGSFSLIPSGVDSMGQVTFRLAPAMCVPPPPGLVPPVVQQQPPSFSEVVSSSSSQASVSVQRQSRPRTKVVPSAAQSGPVPSVQPAKKEVPSQPKVQGPATAQVQSKVSSVPSRAPSAKGRTSSAHPRQSRAPSAHSAYHKVLTSEACQCSLDFASGEPGMKFRHMQKFHSLKTITLVCTVCQCHFVSGQEFLGHIYNAHQDLVKAKGYPTPSDFAKIADSGSYVRAKIGAYLRIPFCKGCGYSHNDLFTKGLGCWCKSRRPEPGRPTDWNDKRFRVQQQVLPKTSFQFQDGKAIPADWVCQGVGTPFVPPYRATSTATVSAPSAPQVKDSSPKVVSFPADVEMRDASSREASPNASPKRVLDVPVSTSAVSLGTQRVSEESTVAWAEACENPLPPNLQQPAWAVMGVGDGPQASSQSSVPVGGSGDGPQASSESSVPAPALDVGSAEDGELSSSGSAASGVGKRKKRRKKRADKKAKKGGEDEPHPS